MKKAIVPNIHFLMLFFFFSAGLKAQNLVPNYSFEDWISCPNAFGQMYAADWTPGTSGTSDYYNTCVIDPNPPAGFVPSVPINFFGTQEPNTGNGYTGMWAHTGPNTHANEYIQTILTEPLVAGECYDVEMFVSPGESYPDYGMSHFGMFISVDPPVELPGNILIEDAQIYFEDLVLDTVNWVPLTGTYVATGGEQYLTIGNFFEIGVYDIALLGQDNGQSPEAAYYFVDDVRIELSQGSGQQDIEAAICEGECYEYENIQYCDQGVYDIPVQGSCFSNVTLTITQQEFAIAQIAPPSVLDCNNPLITLDASGSSSGPTVNYQWTGPNNYSSTLQNPEVFDPGNYTLIVDGENLCPAEMTIEVIQNIGQPDILAEVSGVLNCNNASVTLTGSSSSQNVTYQWNGPGVDINSPIAETSQTGIYTLTITGDNGCTSTEAINVLEDFEVPDIFAEALGLIDCNNAIVVLSGSSGTPNVTYTWSGPGLNTNGPVANTNLPGLYTFAVFGPNGCISTTSVNVIQDIESPIADAGPDGNLTCDEAEVTLDGSSSTGNNLVFQWLDENSQPIDDQPITQVNQTGTFTLIVTNGDNGCTDSAFVEIIPDSNLPTAVVDFSEQLNCQNTSVTLDGSNSSSVSNNSAFEWLDDLGNSISMDEQINVSSPGFYTLIITDNENGCTHASEVEVIQDVENPIADAGPDPNLTCDETEVTLDASNSTGNNLSFQWLDQNNQIVDSIAIIQVDQIGTFTLIVTNGDNSCTDSASVEVIPDSNLPTAVVEFSEQLNCQNTAVTLDGSSSTSVSNNSAFEWLDDLGNSISMDEQITVSSPGFYTLIITDNENGCTHASEVEVIQDVENPVADAGSDGNLTCDETEVTLDASNSTGSNLSFQWLDQNNQIVDSLSVIQVTQTGTFTLIVTNGDNGCTDSASVEVVPDSNLPTAIVEFSEQLNCQNTTVTLDGSSSTSVSNNSAFEWLDDLGNSISMDEQINVSSPGFYTLIITDNENGCTHASEVEVIQNIENPVADAGPDGNLTCDETEATLDASNSTGSNLSFQWLDQNNQIVDSLSVIQVTQTGTFTLIVTNGDNGCTDSASVEVIPDSNLPTAVVEFSEQLNCQNIEVTLDGSSSTSVSNNSAFEWLDDLGNSISMDEQINVSAPGFYTLIITDNENGCTHASEVEVIQDVENPVADAGPDGNLTCDETEVTLDASNSTGNNLSFQWLDQNNQIVDSLAIIQVDQTGTFTLIVTNGDNGCTDSASVEVIPDSNLPTAVVDFSEQLNCQNTAVTLNGTNSSSVSNNSAFEWLDNMGNSISMDEQINVSSPGFYTLIITDNENGCTHSSEVEVIQDIGSPVADAGPDGNLTCDETEATLDASNSTGTNLSFQWLDQNNQIVDSLSVIQVDQTGTFTLIVTNGDNGCTDSASVEVIPDSNLPTAIVEFSEQLNCQNTAITLDGSNSTSVSNNSAFEWLDDLGSSISMDEQISVSSPGFYTLIITDNENGCTHASEVEIIQDVENPIADAGPDGNLTCHESEVTLDASNSTGNNLSFQWLDQNNQIVDSLSVIQVDQTGTFTLIVTNGDNGCTDSASVEVIPDSNLPTAIVEFSEQLNCLNIEITLDGSNSSSVSNNSAFEWLDDLGNSISMDEQINVSSPGFYTLVITDNENGCTHASEVEVIQDVENPIADAGPDGSLTCDETEVTLDASNSTGSNLSFQWLNQNNQIVDSIAIIQVDQIGTFTLIVTNGDNGCIDSAFVEVIPDSNLPTAIVDFPEQLNCQNTTVTLNGSNSSSVSNNFAFEWLDDMGNSISMDEQISVSSPGFYTLIITDNENGCTHASEVEIIQDVQSPSAIIDETGPLNFDCNTSSLILDANASSPFGNISFEWFTIDGNILSDGDTPNPEINEAGTYVLTITNLSNFCTAIDSIIIGEDFNAPIASIEMPQILTCLITETSLDASASATNGDFIYSWTSVPSGGIVSGGNTLQPIINQPGIYILSVLNNENGCTTEAQIIVNQDINPPTAVTSVNDQFDCLTESVTLSGQGSSQGLEIIYQWTGSGIIENAFSLTPTVYQTGDYSLLVTDQQNGCTASSTVNVLEK